MQTKRRNSKTLDEIDKNTFDNIWNDTKPE